MKRHAEETATESRDRKRAKDDWRAARKSARRQKDIARGAFAGKRIERAKQF